MAMPLCGCGVAGCGCCDGTTVLTPAPVWNRAGLPAVTDRIGTHGAFLETMKARLQKIEIDAPGPDGQTIRSYRPLQALTTRDPSDPAIALLDGWAVLADVLTFYQERITNEGYLRTATERGSLMALSRTVGYLPRPGVAASTFLWYTLDASQTVPVDIPEGSAAQSVPGPGEQPQTFETSDDLLARPEWNALPVRQSRPQNITLLGSLTQDAVYLSAANLNLKAGDALLFVFDSSFIPTALADPSGSPPASLRIVASVDNPSGGATAKVNLVPLAALLAGAIPLLAQLRDQAISASGGSTTNTLFSLARVSQQLLTETLLGAVSRPGEWPRHIQRLVTGGDVDPQVDPLIAQLTNAIALLEPPGIGTPVFGGPDSFVPSLLMSGAPQVQGLRRSIPLV